jgi:hypothetical protein
MEAYKCYFRHHIGTYFYCLFFIIFFVFHFFGAKIFGSNQETQFVATGCDIVGWMHLSSLLYSSRMHFFEQHSRPTKQVSQNKNVLSLSIFNWNRLKNDKSFLVYLFNVAFFHCWIFTTQNVFAFYFYLFTYKHE